MKNLIASTDYWADVEKSETLLLIIFRCLITCYYILSRAFRAILIRVLPSPPPLRHLFMPPLREPCWCDMIINIGERGCLIFYYCWLVYCRHTPLGEARRILLRHDIRLINIYAAPRAERHDMPPMRRAPMRRRATPCRAIEVMPPNSWLAWCLFSLFHYFHGCLISRRWRYYKEMPCWWRCFRLFFICPPSSRHTVIRAKDTRDDMMSIPFADDAAILPRHCFFDATWCLCSSSIRYLRSRRQERRHMLIITMPLRRDMRAILLCYDVTHAAGYAGYDTIQPSNQQTILRWC